MRGRDVAERQGAVLLQKRSWQIQELGDGRAQRCGFGPVQVGTEEDLAPLFIEETWQADNERPERAGARCEGPHRLFEGRQPRALGVAREEAGFEAVTGRFTPHREDRNVGSPYADLYEQKSRRRLLEHDGAPRPAGSPVAREGPFFEHARFEELVD